MEIDGTIPLVKFSTRILNKVEGRRGGGVFQFGKEFWAFLEVYKLQPWKDALTENVKEIGGGAEQCLQRGMLITYPTCVPGVVAGSPGQIPGEAVGQVKDGPG